MPLQAAVSSLKWAHHWLFVAKKSKLVLFYDLNICFLYIGLACYCFISKIIIFWRNLGMVNILLYPIANYTFRDFLPWTVHFKWVRYHFDSVCKKIILYSNLMQLIINVDYIYCTPGACVIEMVHNSWTLRAVQLPLLVYGP